MLPLWKHPVSGPISNWKSATFSRRAANAASGAECAYGHGIEVLSERESMFAGVEYDASESALTGDVVTEPCEMCESRLAALTSACYEYGAPNGKSILDARNSPSVVEFFGHKLNLFFKRRTLYQTPVKYSSSTLQKSKIAWCKKFRYHTKEAA